MGKSINNWYVVTGGPSSGKTTILEYLGKMRYKVYYEWARILIDQELAKGLKIEEIRKDEMKFQEKVLDLKINFEKKLDPKDQIFMERGIPDTQAYLNFTKAKIKPSWNKAIKKSNYKKVFIMEIGEFKKDYARTESAEEAMEIDRLLSRSYKSLDIPVVRVPFMTVSKRAKFILDNL